MIDLTIDIIEHVAIALYKNKNPSRWREGQWELETYAIKARYQKLAKIAIEAMEDGVDRKAARISAHSEPSSSNPSEYPAEIDK